MTLVLTENPTVKSIGASGQISLGKEFAGRQVLVDSPAKGVWIIRTATIIPDNEAWLHEEKTLNSLKKAIAWAAKHPAKSSNPDDLPATKNSGVISNKLRAANCVGAKVVLLCDWFQTKLSRARATKASLPSTPNTRPAMVAIGKVKFPKPQNQSITRSWACASSNRKARVTNTRLICGLTCVKSVGLNGIVTPNPGNSYASCSCN